MHTDPMKTVYMYFEDLRLKYGSYYQVSKQLGITQASISEARKTGHIKDSTAMAVAKALGIDAGEVLLQAAIERAPSEDIADEYRQLKKFTDLTGEALTLTTSHNVYSETDKPAGHWRRGMTDKRGRD